jgi:predicted transcriptional regulator
MLHCNVIVNLNDKHMSCKEKILSSILSKPTTFMKLVSESNCASETVEKYLSIYLDNEQICQKKSKFRILYSPELCEPYLDFFELLLNPTIKSVILILLKSESLSQIELVAISDKSNPSVSRALKLLLDKKMIRRNYHAPYSTYEIIDKHKIFDYLKKTIPTIAEHFDQFDLCYPKPTIFINVHT